MGYSDGIPAVLEDRARWPGAPRRAPGADFGFEPFAKALKMFSVCISSLSSTVLVVERRMFLAILSAARELGDCHSNSCIVVIGEYRPVPGSECVAPHVTSWLDKLLDGQVGVLDGIMHGNAPGERITS